MSYLLAIVMILAMADSKPELEPWQEPNPGPEYVSPDEFNRCVDKLMTNIELRRMANDQG